MLYVQITIALATVVAALAQAHYTSIQTTIMNETKAPRDAVLKIWSDDDHLRESWLLNQSPHINICFKNEGQTVSGEIDGWLQNGWIAPNNYLQITNIPAGEYNCTFLYFEVSTLHTPSKWTTLNLTVKCSQCMPPKEFNQPLNVCVYKDDVNECNK